MSLDNDAGVSKCVCLCGTVAVRFGSFAFQADCTAASRDPVAQT